MCGGWLLMKTKEYNAIIETPKGSRNKYKYDSISHSFKLDKVLPAGFAFPYDFGFIPGTLAEDKDPLDVLVLTEEATFTGCLVECRILGVIKATQTKNGETIRNDRIVAVPANSEQYKSVHSISDMKKHLLREMEYFFVSYHRYNGVTFKPIGKAGPKQAIKIIEQLAHGTA